MRKYFRNLFFFLSYENMKWFSRRKLVNGKKVFLTLRIHFHFILQGMLISFFCCAVHSFHRNFYLHSRHEFQRKRTTEPILPDIHIHSTMVTLIHRHVFVLVMSIECSSHLHAPQKHAPFTECGKIVGSNAMIGNTNERHINCYQSTFRFGVQVCKDIRWFFFSPSAHSSFNRKSRTRGKKYLVPLSFI